AGVQVLDHPLDGSTWGDCNIGLRSVNRLVGEQGETVRMLGDADGVVVVGHDPDHAGLDSRPVDPNERDAPAANTSQSNSPLFVAGRSLAQPELARGDRHAWGGPPGQQ